MTKREKVLTSITSVSLAIALPRHPCYATTLRGTRAGFHPFHYKPEDIEVVTFSSLELERDPSGISCRWHLLGMQKTSKKSLPSSTGSPPPVKKCMTTLECQNQTVFSFG